MANKSLFASMLGRLPKANAVNEAGGLAYKLEPKHALAQVAATGTFGNAFYSTAETQLDEVLKLIAEVDDNQYLAKLALYARENAFMKDMPAALLVALSVRDTELMHRVFDRVVDNGRVLRTVFQMIRSGQFKNKAGKGRVGLSSSVQRAFQRWLNTASVGKLLSASIGNDPSLRDILRMARPTPKDNGPYYRPFRNFMLERTSIISIHLFDARDSAFAEDDVLQENIILHLQKGVPQGAVLISKSTNRDLDNLSSEFVDFERIVHPGDEEKFIRIPNKAGQEANESLSANPCTLQQLGVTVSTGPVVDFRLKTHLRSSASSDDAPLLYLGHFAGGFLSWPRADFKKPNGIAINDATQRWLFPPGHYVAVKRFTAKEEHRRVVAMLVDPTALPELPYGFENHLNIYHENRGPLPEDLARGLVAFLNTQAVDDWFREFNGHTQVNATDLRSLAYPSRDALIDLGRSQVACKSHK